MVDTPLQSIQKIQTDATIFDNFLNNAADNPVDFSAAQDGSDMRPSLMGLAANLGLRPASGGTVAAAQTSNLPTNTYNNGTLGVGATITGSSNGALPSADIDGVAPVANMRIWIGQVGNPGIRAGVYVITQVGDGSHPFILTRATDADTADELGYCTVFVTGGATLANAMLLIAMSGADITVGMTNLPVIQLPIPDANAVQNGQRSCSNTQSADFTLDGSAYLWLVDDSGGNRVVTVPPGANFANQEWRVKKVSSNAHHTTITMQGGETIDGAATYQLNNQFAAVTFQNKRGSTFWEITSLYLS